MKVDLGLHLMGLKPWHYFEAWANVVMAIFKTVDVPAPFMMNFNDLKPLFDWLGAAKFVSLVSAAMHHQFSIESSNSNS